MPTKTPLHISSFNGKSEDVINLIQSKVDVNECDTESLETPIFMASQNGHLDIVKKLILAKADINLSNKYKCDPLMAASYYGHEEVVKELIKFGANPNKKDIFGQSPLFLASKKGNLKIVQELINAGANVNEQNNDNENPLYEAIKRFDEQAGKLSIRDQEESTLDIIELEKTNYLEIAKTLISANADVNHPNKDRETPLLVAMLSGNEEIIKAFDFYEDHNKLQLWQLHKELPSPPPPSPSNSPTNSLAPTQFNPKDDTLKR